MLSNILPSRRLKQAASFATACFFLVLLLRVFHYPEHSSLHLLVPATSSNIDLCRLLLSSTILQYPTPIFINWGATEDQNAYKQHLAKVDTILKHLDEIFSAGKRDDLVLIVDGFDIHFQLPPDVMIKRYFEVNKAADIRTQNRVGKYNMTRHGLKQTILFGHDKLCWPMEFKRPACWAVPEASTGKYAFGPNTDQTGDALWWNAKWLNSGTIMGPVDDVRAVFRATLDLINANHTTDSDQFYFANLFGSQEYSRRLLQADPFGDVADKEKNWPALGPGQKTEYHIGIDYDGTLFQTMAFFRQSITWMKFTGEDVARLPDSGSPQRQTLLQLDAYHQKKLPADLKMAAPPFEAGSLLDGSHLPSNTGWKDLSLGVNVISEQIFPLLHFTGPKEFRERWWSQMWFVPYAGELLKASVQNRQGLISNDRIGGKHWWKGEAKVKDTPEFGDKGGAFGDNGAFLPWSQLCGTHESMLFSVD